jgi:hypothetical protein
MAKQKRSAARAPGGKVAKNKTGAQPKKAQETKTAEVIPEQKETAKTPVKEIKIEQNFIDPQPLKKGDQFLFIIDNEEKYLTRSVADVIIQRNSAEIEIPEGSGYTPPKGSKCKGCG